MAPSLNTNTTHFFIFFQLLLRYICQGDDYGDTVTLLSWTNKRPNHLGKDHNSFYPYIPQKSKKNKWTQDFCVLVKVEKNLSIINCEIILASLEERQDYGQSSMYSWNTFTSMQCLFWKVKEHKVNLCFL